MALLESAKNISDVPKALGKSSTDSGSEDDADSFYCRASVQRMLHLPRHIKVTAQHKWKLHTLLNRKRIVIG